MFSSNSVRFRLSRVSILFLICRFEGMDVSSSSSSESETESSETESESDDSKSGNDYMRIAVSLANDLSIDAPCFLCKMLILLVISEYSTSVLSK